jgi:bifunctional DNase/RNase
MTQEEMITIGEVFLKSDARSGNMVVLKESKDAELYFMMFVGESEFAAIAKEKGLVKPERPLTYELYLNILETLPVEFLRIQIDEMRQETYFAKVVFRADGIEQAVDSRPSDAVALALHRHIPIQVNRALFHRQLSEKEMKEYEEIVKSVKF